MKTREDGSKYHDWQQRSSRVEIYEIEEDSGFGKVIQTEDTMTNQYGTWPIFTWEVSVGPFTATGQAHDLRSAQSRVLCILGQLSNLWKRDCEEGKYG